MQSNIQQCYSIFWTLAERKLSLLRYEDHLVALYSLDFDTEESVNGDMKSDKYERFLNNPEDLQALETDQLRTIWRALFKDRCQPRSRDLVIREIVHLLQERAHGGMSVRAQNQMSRLVDGKVQQSVNKYTFDSNSQIVREWNGKKYHVAVLGKNAFKYDGKHYKTLSAVAKEITGAHWSGPLFFGLRKQGHGEG